MAPLELLFTGSVPLQPAAAVFEALQKHCGQRLRRMPDGEQLDWVFGAWKTVMEHPAVEVGEGPVATTADTPFGGMPSPVFTLREGVAPRDIRIERFGIADVINESYRQLTELKRGGKVPEEVRLQATITGPGTAGAPFGLSWEDMTAILNPPLVTEVAAITDTVPLRELAVQLDLAVEIELEEVRRNPEGFGVPAVAALDELWGDCTLETLMTSNAEIANHVPAEAELGFHLCSVWHMDPRGGQDLQVHVDAANLLAEKVDRRIDYIHMPVLPEYQPADYAKLAGLRLAPETKLFLGLIHPSDGIDAVKRRIEMASAVAEDFGVGYFCGLRDLNQVGTGGLDEMFKLHGQVAQL